MKKQALLVALVAMTLGISSAKAMQKSEIKQFIAGLENLIGGFISPEVRLEMLRKRVSAQDFDMTQGFNGLGSDMSECIALASELRPEEEVIPRPTAPVVDRHNRPAPASTAYRVAYTGPVRNGGMSDRQDLTECVRDMQDNQ